MEKSMQNPKHPLIHRDSPAWALQVWVSIGLAVVLRGVGLAHLPGTDLDRACLQGRMSRDAADVQ